MKSIIYKNLPEVIKTVLLSSEGWLVGKSIEQLLTKEVKDYDIIVPNRELYYKTINLLKSFYNYDFNNYGGVKFKDSDLQIDIWCEELDHFLLSANYVNYIFNFKKQILLKND